MSRRTGTSYCWGVLSGPRLRQVALVARDCGQVAGELHPAGVIMARESPR